MQVFGGPARSNESFERMKNERENGEHLDMKQLSLNEIMMVASSSHGSNNNSSFERQ